MDGMGYILGVKSIDDISGEHPRSPKRLSHKREHASVMNQTFIIQQNIRKITKCKIKYKLPLT